MDKESFSKMIKLKTKCCNFVFYGENHSPEWKGYCRNCGKVWIGVVKELKVEGLK